MKDSELIQAVFAKNRASKKQCKDCIYYVENYKDDYTLRHFGYGEIKYRPACRFNNNYMYVGHNPARLCGNYERIIGNSALARSSSQQEIK